MTDELRTWAAERVPIVRKQIEKIADNIDAEFERVAQAIDDTLVRGECIMRLAFEEEDADGCIWPDHYECSVCGAKVHGILPCCDIEIPPRFCPNCGRRVRSSDERY